MPSTIPQGRDGPASAGSGLCFHPSIKEIYSCKYLAFPWDYKRGARVHNWGEIGQVQKNTHAHNTLSQSNSPHSVHTKPRPGT